MHLAVILVYLTAVCCAFFALS